MECSIVIFQFSNNDQFYERNNQQKRKIIINFLFMIKYLFKFLNIALDFDMIIVGKPFI